MFIGHFAVGFGAKKAAPAISLGFLFVAAQFLDLLWPILVLANVEHVEIAPGITKMTPLNFANYPVSHSLLMTAIWGACMAGVSWFIWKNKRYVLVVFLCVVSHWFLDLLVHRPDLPLYPGNSPKAGFGLWNYPFIAIILESLIFIAGVYFYIRLTSAKNRFGKYGLYTLVVFLAFIQIGNLAGPPPPNVEAIAWAGQLQWIFVILAFFVDKNRITTEKSGATSVD